MITEAFATCKCILAIGQTPSVWVQLKGRLLRKFLVFTVVHVRRTNQVSDGLIGYPPCSRISYLEVKTSSQGYINIIDLAYKDFF
jgi:hypothetical protein